MTTETRNGEQVVDGYIVRLNGRAWGIALGLLLGFGLFAATNILLLQGGDNVGQHLGLLRRYLPGFEVSFLGSLIGFAWAFVIGFTVGRVVCLVYNAAARR